MPALDLGLEPAALALSVRKTTVHEHSLKENLRRPHLKNSMAALATGPSMEGDGQELSCREGQCSGLIEESHAIPKMDVQRWGLRASFGERV